MIRKTKEIMVCEENFLVRVPQNSQFCVGDVVDVTTEINLQEGIVLYKGWVVAMDRDPAQIDSYIKGLKSGIKSVLPTNALQKAKQPYFVLI